MELYKYYNLKIDKEITSCTNNNIETITEDRRNILDFFDENGILIAKDIISEWFPNKKFDIFISHSHRDKSKALSLSSYLYKNLGLNCFVDSTVWGYVNKILKQIDKKFCKKEGRNDYTSYDYDMRNISTAHVHNMLSIALSRMMDQCECLIFLNTENSIIPNENIETSDADETYSCWIYYELSIRKLLRISLPERLKNNMSFEDLQKAENVVTANTTTPIARYDIDTSDMKTITFSNIERWVNNCSSYGDKSLDNLYKMYKTPI